MAQVEVDRSPAAVWRGPLADSLSMRDFLRLADLVERRIGIRLPPAKRDLVEHRLQRRLRELGYASYGAYCAERLGDEALEEEFPFLVNCLTTNKTDFFREPSHFAFLTGTALPTLLAREEAGKTRPLLAWSAAASTGPEPYTIAMVLAEYARTVRPFRFHVHGSDIDTEVLHEAVRAIYDRDLVAPVPDDMRRQYLLRARDRADRTVRIAPELRHLTSFWEMNLLEPRYPLDSPVDILFCRNVLIYFNRANQHKVLAMLCRHLRPGGYLFVGHSETLNGLELPVRAVAPSVYLRT